MKKNSQIDQPGTVFQKKVWRAVCSIPSGQTWTYTKLARFIGHPRAARAVGSALSKNKFPVLIPCHRVVPKAGGVGGYIHGKKRKQQLLDREKSSKN